jgi:hypothetical protein
MQKSCLHKGLRGNRKTSHGDVKKKCLSAGDLERFTAFRSAADWILLGEAMKIKAEVFREIIDSRPAVLKVVHQHRLRTRKSDGLRPARTGVSSL